MKKSLFILSVLLTFVTHLNAQNYMKQVFTKHLEQQAKSAGELYLIKTGYSTTALVVSIASTDVFTGAFLVVGKDTSYLKPDEDSEPGELSLYSNLLTFPAPIDSFYFYPGKITSEITFYFINSAIENESAPSGFLNKKKVPVAPCPIWWTNRFGEQDYRHLITTGSTNRYLI